MTASEIYDIVKDVPKEAWPEGIELGTIPAIGRIAAHECIRDHTGYVLHASHVELIFIGSMTRWLVERDGLSEWCFEHCGTTADDTQNVVAISCRPLAEECGGYKYRGGVDRLLTGLARACIARAATRAVGSGE